jgi:hypothetical protein
MTDERDIERLVELITLKVQQRLGAAAPAGEPAPLHEQPCEAGPSEDCGECGICVDPQDTSALADAIELLVMDRPYASRLGANGRSAIQTRYRWDRELDALEGFYLSIIGSSRTDAST